MCKIYYINKKGRPFLAICCVHFPENISQKVRVTDRAEICGDFKSVYCAEDEEAARTTLAIFFDKWK
ncbi:transposase [Paenibacillus sp. BIC5C1]|uniref:transposase n=1 Tax=Paenibacillus sp. BIC5C1 TaxID=3078263 RepID=UPI0037C7BBD3